MAYVPVPKDLNAVKTKVMFNLTKRQILCFGGGALIGVPLFFLLKGHIGSSAAALCMMLVMLPFFLLAMYEKNGQPPEKLIRNIVQVCFLRPKQRPYRTNNFYDLLNRQDILDKEVYAIVHKQKTPQESSHEPSESRSTRRLQRAKRQDKRKKSAQDSIPFQRMYPDGVCRVTDNYYTKTVQFQDINYQLNQNEDKTAIFDGWCDFLNYFDSSIRFQLSFINLSATRDTYARRIAIPCRATASTSSAPSTPGCCKASLHGATTG